MLSLYEASDLLRRATFKIRIENNTLGYLGGTGFFISKDGYALTAYHNLPKSVLQTGKGTLEINYKNQWLTVDCLLHISSKESDIAVLKLTEVKDVSIEFVKIGYVNPSLSFRERTQFWGGRPVCAFGFPFVGKGQADRLVDGTIDGGQPLTTLPEPTENSFGEEIEVQVERLRFMGARAHELEGISGAPILDRQTGLVVAVEGCYQPYIQVMYGAVVLGSEIGKLHESWPDFPKYAKLIPVQKPWWEFFLQLPMWLRVVIVITALIAALGYMLLVQKDKRDNTGKPVPPTIQVFDVERYYVPSGKMGDIGDVTIAAGDSGARRFTYETRGQGPHEWDYKYVNNQLNPEPAQFVGVVYLSPPNEFGTARNGGYDLRGFRRIEWKARSRDGEVQVEFVIGGIDWVWHNEQGEWEKVSPPYPDTMPRTSLGIRTLTQQWQSFEDSLSDLQNENFKRVVGGFGWVISWGFNGVELNDARTGPREAKRFTIEIRDIQYRR